MLKNATRKLALKTLVAATFLATAGMAVPAAKTTTFAVTATVVANCFINSAANLAFGSYNPGTGNLDVDSAGIVVRCSNTTAYGIDLDAGTGVGSTLGQRTMSIGAGGANNTVNYQLYTNVGRTVPWVMPGVATSAAGNLGGTGTGLGNTFTHIVRGRLQDDATSQAATPSTLYTSTVTVTINY